MDTIRCNMCGNDNPIEAEYCQFCNAKLIKNQGQFEASQEASEESLSDWLGKLREDSTDNVHKETSYDEQISSTPDNNETLQADNSTDDDTPVWLDRIRSLNQIDNGSSIEETKIEDESDDQFLSSSEKVRQWLEDLKLQDGEKEEEELDIKLDHEEISPPLVSEEEISVNNIADGDIDLGKNDTNAAEDKIFEFETLSDDINIESDQSSDEISIPEFQEDIPEDNEVFNSSIIDDAIKQIQFSQDETLNIVNKHTVSDKPDDQTDPGKIEDSVTDQNDILENDDEISLPTPAFSGKDLPDWLGEFAESGESTLEKVEKDQATEFTDDNLPDWLSKLKEKHPDDFIKPLDSLIPEEEPVVQPVKEIDQTFIQDDHVEEIFHIEEEITSIEEPSDTEKQAFEQIDVQIDSINDKQPEPEISNIYEPDFVEEMSEGPLAGIEGILPSESIVTQYKKPPSYSGNFEITEKQRVFATILENSLKPKSTETKTTEKLSEKAGFIIVALLMMTILVLTLVFSKNNSVSSIHQNSSYSQAFYDVINNIPDNGVVLFAVEYEPAYADELNTPTNLVLDQLIKKNSGIVFLSTIPSGSIIAENILINAKSDPSYNNYINLGYLAGGTASIKSFALNPQKTVPYSLSTPIDSFQPWDSSILENIKHINDFDGIIIATEKFETGRSWIEQINPLLDNSTPMLYIASSQITPLIDAYLDSKQIDALLSGVYEINNYANLSGYTSKTKNYQPAYSVGLIILVISTISGVTIQQLLKQKSRSSLNEE